MFRKTHTHNALTCIVLKLACSNYPAAELLGWQEWKWVPIIKCTTEKIEHYRRSTMGLMLLCHSSINAKRLRKALIFQLFHHWFQFKRKASTWYHSSQWDASKTIALAAWCIPMKVSHLYGMHWPSSQSVRQQEIATHCILPPINVNH